MSFSWSMKPTSSTIIGTPTGDPPLTSRSPKDADKGIDEASRDDEEIYENHDHKPDLPHCKCRQPARGEMIACDNPRCPVEWYHLDCVRLKEAPSGKWFCKICTTDKLMKITPATEFFRWYGDLKKYQTAGATKDEILEGERSRVLGVKERTHWEGISAGEYLDRLKEDDKRDKEKQAKIQEADASVKRKDTPVAESDMEESDDIEQPENMPFADENDDNDIEIPRDDTQIAAPAKRPFKKKGAAQVVKKKKKKTTATAVVGKKRAAPHASALESARPAKAKKRE